MPSVIDFASDVARLLRGADTPRRLTRTERAAAELALGVLRTAHCPVRRADYWWVSRACEALRLAHMYPLAWLPHDWLPDPARSQAEYRRTVRLVRARLALCLRTLLRADRGDLGPWRAGRYDTRARMHDITRRIRPLWQVASEARHA